MAWLSGIRLKLLLLLSVATIAIAAQGFYAWVSAKELFRITTAFKEQRMPLAESLARLNEDLNHVFRYTSFTLAQRAANENAAKYWKKAGEAIASARENSSVIKNAAPPEPALRAIDALEGELAKIEALKQKNEDLLFRSDAAGIKAGAEDIIRAFPAHGVAVNEQILIIQKALEGENKLLARSAEAVYAQTLSLAIALALGSFALLWLFGGFITRLLVRQLSASIGSVSGSSRSILSSSGSLAASSQQLASATQEQASSVEQTSASLEQISNMVASSLQSSQHSVSLSNQVSAMVGTGTEIMNELRGSVSEIAGANARVEGLAKLMEEIGEKTELIDEIVMQTRLLSFNASVEAERAGEHGRGFAVVAQEIGNLAQMSGKSASEIGQIVRNSVREAQEVANLNRDKVARGVQLVGQAAEQLEGIHGASKEILAAANQVLRSSEEQNAGVRQINTAIRLISQSTQENAKSSSECSAAGQTLASQGESLASVVGDLQAIVYGAHRSEPAVNAA